MSDETNEAQTEAEEFTALMAELLTTLATIDHVEARLADLDAQWRESRPDREAERAENDRIALSHRAWQEDIEGRYFARNVERDEKWREEDRAFLRVTRLAEVAAQFAKAADRVDDTVDQRAARDPDCVARAARLIALCEAEAAR